jgi:hypothetical protein
VRLSIVDPKTNEVLINKMVDFAPGGEYPLSRYLEPTYPQHLTIGASWLALKNREVERQYAPSALWGGELRYRYDEALRNLDLTLSVRYFSADHESFTASNNVKFTQNRRMVLLGAKVGGHLPAPLLSTSSRSIVAEQVWDAGPSVMNIRLQTDALASRLFADRDRSSWVTGLSAGYGLNFLITPSFLQLGATVSGEMYQNFAKEGAPWIYGTGISFSAGNVW